MITNELNQIVLEPQERQDIWEKYVEDARPELERDGHIYNNLPILKSEVKYAIKRIKLEKSPKPCMPTCLSSLKNIISKNWDIYQIAKFSREWLKFIFIPLPKKPNSKKCKDFRLISLMIKRFSTTAFLEDLRKSSMTHSLASEID